MARIGRRLFNVDLFSIVFWNFSAMFDGGEAPNNHFQRSSSRNADLEFG